jgi:hypothetical protein
MAMLLELAQEYSRDLSSESKPSLQEITNQQRMAYLTFLANFTKKIELVKNLDINYGYRATGMGDDYFGR